MCKTVVEQCLTYSILNTSTLSLFIFEVLICIRYIGAGTGMAAAIPTFCCILRTRALFFARSFVRQRKVQSSLSLKV